MSHMQAEGVCLKCPEDLGIQVNLSQELAYQTLVRATGLAAQVPFQWTYIDRPVDGQVLLIFLTNQMSFPIDGIRYQDQEQRYTIPVGSTRELEVSEVKFGFIPGHDNVASRIRRRYRMIKGGHPQLILVHYSRGQSIPIVPSLNQPIRSYPLRPPNEPAVFVVGPRQGQKVYQNGGAPGSMPGPDRGMPPIGFGDPQAMLAQRNNAMEALERRNRAERERSASMVARTGAQARVEEEDSADESEMISIRNLALARYRRNHEFMNAVFNQAAFGKHLEQSEVKPAYAIFNTEDLQSKIAKLETEIDSLDAAATARRMARYGQTFANTSMDVQMEGVPV
ncbi:hypothetical protein BDY19DRAFT_994000 [Irpex rosettiformis]|uniref:Uncharacterized protein n=1 Tax=Irpex rosettiformis TaxID=378272 RepID=A0ACB8U2M7_9APHY|nr:hypothetical protein BDY19DRAFT_994000 [Irpex rosettiformis]